jgi:phosphomannomutase
VSTTATQVYRFGTSGYRTEHADTGFTEAIVRQVTQAIADYWLADKPAQPAVVVSYDRRPISLQRAPQVAQWLTQRGFDVYLTQADTPIPLAAFAAYAPQACGLPAHILGAVYVGASHNPPEHAGINVLSRDGAVMPSAETARIEQYQQQPLPADMAVKPGNTFEFDPFDGYYQHVTQTLQLDLAAIQQANLPLFYDPLYATGRLTFVRLCQRAGIPLQLIHAEDDIPPAWQGQPNPTAEQLADLSQLMKQSQPGPLALGLSNDGDADRFGLLNEHGDYLPTNDVLLLVLFGLAEHQLTGQPYALVRSQASSHALDELAAQYDWPTVQTPVGYKYVAETFIEHQQQGKMPVGLGAEASGGLSMHGHIPEKDGIVANLLVAQLVAKTQTPVSQLLTHIKTRLKHSYYFEEWALKTGAGDVLLRELLALTQQADSPLGQIDTTTTGAMAQALEQHFGTRDGVKLYFTDGSWLLFRKSGTEPLVRFVVEAVASSPDAAQARFQQLKTGLLSHIQPFLGA